jgi:UDP-N-acetylglucosamine--N-acetylmuramyl-(pentapeptide) pyrophosphoryl-undecaprenol N-acetylglucosamine transferase
MEADLVRRAGVPFEAIAAAGLHGVGLRALPGNLLQLGRGYRQARQILRRFRPDALFFTGGFVGVPMALAGRSLSRGGSIPTLLYVPDIEPGLALKFLARFADCIAVNTDESFPYFAKRDKLTVTGYPTRPDLRRWSVEAARRTFGLSADLPTLLVFGGSKGARSINRALLPVLPDLLAEMQIIHLSGTLDWPEVEARRAEFAAQASQADKGHLIDRYHAFPYLYEEMGAALAAADLAVARAGASCLGEFPLMGLPAILVPYPHAWRYQQVNAQYLAGRGAAVVIDDKDLAERLLPVVRDLVRDTSRRESMRQAMVALARPEAAESISQLLHRLATPPKTGTPSGRERV